MSKFTDEQKLLMVRDAEKLPNWRANGTRSAVKSQAERLVDIVKARTASLISRQSTAAKREAEIAKLKLELIAAGLPHSSADIATNANERLLRTSQGHPWTDRAVRDAIRRAAGVSD